MSGPPPAVAAVRSAVRRALAPLPALRLVMWFDQDKLEAETGVTTLWSHSRDEGLTALVRERVG